MASSYRVNWSIGEGTDPTLPGKDAIIVLDGTSDNTSTTLTLTGRNLPVYGEIQQENFVRLMENFANTTPPIQATVGQTWFDSDHLNGNGSLGALKVYRRNYPTASPLLGSGDEPSGAAPNVGWHLVNNPVEILGYRPVDATGLAGDTMAGPLVLPGMPTQPLQAATKSYVDAVATGLSVRDHVTAATTTNLNATYTAGTTDASSGLGVGARLTSSTNGTLTVDGYTAALNDRILVKNQSNPIHNGIYTLTVVGNAGTPWQLTRATDYDNHIAGQVAYGDYVFIAKDGTLADPLTGQGGTGWVMTTAGTAGGDVVRIGTDSIQFTQFSGAGTYISGPGIDITGNTFTNTGPRNLVSGTNITVSAGTGPFGGAGRGDNVTISVTGTVAEAAHALDATNSVNAGVTPDNSNATFYPTFVASTTGNLPIKADADFTYNPSTNTLSVANFVGALTGNATTATNAVTASRLAGGALGSIPYQLSSGNTTMLGIGSNNAVLTVSGGVPTWGPPAGTVFSVGLSAPSFLTVSGSPVTSSGTLTLSLASQAARTFLAAPNGSAGTPSFRGIQASDVPTLNQNTTGNAATSNKAATLAQNGNLGATGMVFNWSGQAGQPTWLWGSNDGANHYVWNPSNFSVAYAASSGNATSASFATTQPPGTNNTTIATTAFVQAAAASGGLGSNWSLPGRSSGVTYVNSNPFMLVVMVSGHVRRGGGWCRVYVNGAMIAACNNGSSTDNEENFTFLVPPGQTYMVQSSTGALGTWAELI